MVVGIVTYIMSKMEERDVEWSALAEIVGVLADVVLYYLIADIVLNVLL